MDQYYRSLPDEATMLNSRKCPVAGEQLSSGHLHGTIDYYAAVKTPLILALGAYYSKTSSATSIF